MRFQVIQHLLAVLLTLFSSARSPHRVRSTPPGPPPQSEPRRINPETDLVYLGAFKLPKIPYVSTGYPKWSYGGSGATYNPDHNSIYAVGFGDCTSSLCGNYVSEITIPPPVISPAKSVAELNTAATLQPFADVTAGYGTSQAQTANALGDIEYRAGALNLTICNSYLPPQTLPVFGCANARLATPDTQGWWTFESFPAAATARYLFQVDPAWAAANTPGKTLAAGRFRNTMGGSWGPSIYAVDPTCPAADGVEAPATQLLYYPGTGTTPSKLAWQQYGDADRWDDGAWLSIGNKSAVAIAGTKAERTVWSGLQYYGGELPHECSTGKGYHGEPYYGAILFYDTADLAAVASGKIPSYQPQPYAIFQIEALRYTGCQREAFGGVAYDRKNELLYVMELHVPVYGEYDRSPIVHVFRARDAGQPPDTQPPTVPQRLSAQALTNTQVTFNWQPSTDNAGGVIYVVYRDPVDQAPIWPSGKVLPPGPKPIAITTAPTYTDTKELASGTLYTYYVAARDSVGNTSAQSSPLAVTVP